MLVQFQFTSLTCKASRSISSLLYIHGQLILIWLVTLGLVTQVNKLLLLSCEIKCGLHPEFSQVFQIKPPNRNILTCITLKPTRWIQVISFRNNDQSCMKHVKVFAKLLQRLGQMLCWEYKWSISFKAKKIKQKNKTDRVIVTDPLPHLWSGFFHWP